MATTSSVLVANILLNTLIDLHDGLKNKIKKDGFLILSGLLYRDRQAILKAYRDLHLVKVLNQDGWTSLLLQKKK